MTDFPIRLTPTLVWQDAQQLDAVSPLEQAVWYRASTANSGVIYQFPVGTLLDAQWLYADFLTDDDETAVLALLLRENAGPDGHVATFIYHFALLPHASARLRMPLAAVNQNRWLYEREGALLKPRVDGVRVDLAKVNQMVVVAALKADSDVQWCMTPFTATVDEPPLLETLTLTRGPLLDELGQSTTRDWPGKTKDEQELTQRLHKQLEAAPKQQWPDGFSRFGGWSGKQFEATGFFRTHWDDLQGRWWLVDPDGHIFWSTGQDCVRVDTEANIQYLEAALCWKPESNSVFASIYSNAWDKPHINYLQANFMRAFGADQWYERWGEITLSLLRSNGFNTVANWSDWQIAHAAGFPYVRTLDMRPVAVNTPTIYRAFPDVFDSRFVYDANAYVEPLASTKDDPALIGYFLMNEPTWGFSDETPAAGMLFNTPTCKTRDALTVFLRERYEDDAALANAWQIDTSFEAVQSGVWTTPLTSAAQTDLTAFSQIMVDKFFRTLSEAARKVDSNHLNLGTRYHTVPPTWAQQGMRSFDVFSINCYQRQVPASDLKAIHDLLDMPTIVGEWHFGALDVGLPASGVGPRVKDQNERGKAYRYYVEQAAALPWCVGTHHFNHYDQSALGRFDGETYNIGFYDICYRPYSDLVDAARLTHERLYPVALGDVKPFDRRPEYLGRLFF